MSDRTIVVRRQFDMSADTYSGVPTHSASFQAQRHFAVEKWRPIAGHAWFASVCCLSVRRGQGPGDRRTAAVGPLGTIRQNDAASRKTGALQAGITNSPVLADRPPRIA
jgi:hypothetical protein